MKRMVEMMLEKETKGAVRYKEKGEPEKHMLKTIYVRKSALKDGMPKEIQVTVVSVEVE